MLSNQADIQRLDNLFEQLLRGEAVAVEAGHPDDSGEMAANVMVGQLLKTALASTPTTAGKARARARLYEAAQQPVRESLWSRLTSPLLVRGAATAAAAFVVALVASQATASESSPAQVVAFAPASVTTHVALAEEQINNTFTPEAAQSATVTEPPSEVSQTLTLATQGIVQAEAPAHAEAGMTQLVESAERVMSTLESNADSTAAQRVGELYAEAIESTPVGSPAILGIGGTLTINLPGLEPGAVEVQGFRLDDHGGTWQAAWTIATSAGGGIEIQLPSGTYSRLKLTKNNRSGTSSVDIARPFTIQTGGSSVITPGALEWQTTPSRSQSAERSTQADDGESAASNGHDDGRGAATNDPARPGKSSTSQGQGKAQDHRESPPSAGPKSEHPSNARGGKQSPEATGNAGQKGNGPSPGPSSKPDGRSSGQAKAPQHSAQSSPGSAKAGASPVNGNGQQKGRSNSTGPSKHR